MQGIPVFAMYSLMHEPAIRVCAPDQRGVRTCVVGDESKFWFGSRTSSDRLKSFMVAEPGSVYLSCLSSFYTPGSTCWMHEPSPIHVGLKNTLYLALHIWDTDPNASLTSQTVNFISRLLPSLVIINTILWPWLYILWPLADLKGSPASDWGVLTNGMWLHQSLGITDAQAPEPTMVGKGRLFPVVSGHIAHQSLIVFIFFILIKVLGL